MNKTIKFQVVVNVFKKKSLLENQKVIPTPVNFNVTPTCFA